MLKGINHSVIEVNDFDNDYYERAILIIKPEYASVQRNILENEARQMLKEMDAPSVFHIKNNRFKKVLGFVGAVVVGAVLSAVLCLVF